VSGILSRERGASAGHNNHDWRGGVTDDTRHVDVGFSKSFYEEDLVSVAIIGNEIAFLDLFKVLKNGGSMADNEEFVLETLIGTSDSGRRDELVIFKSEWLDWGGEIDAGDFESRITDGFDMAGGLKASIEINWQDDEEECRENHLNGAERPRKWIKNMTFNTFHLMLIIA